MKKNRHLTYEDRCQIHALLKRGFAQTEIARDIAVHRSTICRELRRNAGRTGYYYHWVRSKADDRQAKRDSRPLKMLPALVAFVEGRLREGWSPQQISEWLRHRQDRLATVSHERIYQHVWAGQVGRRQPAPASAPPGPAVRAARLGLSAPRADSGSRGHRRAAGERGQQGACRRLGT
jgi:IS30 family transposase